VIHFGEEFLGKDFFSIPEMIHVKELFQRSVVGTQVLGNTRKEIADMMVAMLSLSGPARIIKLLVILEILSSSKELVNLASPGYLQQAVYPGNDRLSKVYEHIMANFSDNITLKEAANMANMSVPSFSRFFKSCTRKGFSHFLNEIRVGYACKLLVEER